MFDDSCEVEDVEEVLPKASKSAISQQGMAKAQWPNSASDLA